MANLNAVLSRPKVDSNYSRNAFDRSENKKYTYDLGMLCPCFAQPFIAGSHVKLNRSIFQRTKAVNTAAFPTVDTHVEFFYVPLRLLWSYWNNFKLNIQDYNSTYMLDSNLSPVSPITTPYFDLNKVMRQIAQMLNGDVQTSSIFATINDVLPANRLLDMLGYGWSSRGASWGDSGNFYVNPFKLLAYQKIYYDHFRNTAYESNQPQYYNVDRFTGSSLDDAEIRRILQIRFVNYRRDYFKSIYPALNYTVSNPNGQQWAIPSSVQYRISAASSANTANILPNSSSGGQISILSGSNSNGINFTSVQQIRAAFALDKLLRASAYAPKHVKDQFEARYGVKNVEGGNESVRIGAFMNDVIFQEVTASATTSDARLGDIGAKGVGFNGYQKDIEFTCKEDCIILGVSYSMPRSSYDSTMVMNWNQKTDREDFFIPEYMNLGLQPIYGVELNTFQNQALSQGQVLGYVPRYQEYKVGIDVNHMNFCRNGILSDFTNHTNNSVGVGAQGVSSAYFKVQMNDLDSVFMQNTTPDPSTDSFITYLQIKCICNQNMSVHGQPVLASM